MGGPAPQREALSATVEKKSPRIISAANVPLHTLRLCAAPCCLLDQARIGFSCFILPQVFFLYSAASASSSGALAPASAPELPLSVHEQLVSASPGVVAEQPEPVHAQDSEHLSVVAASLEDTPLPDLGGQAECAPCAAGGLLDPMAVNRRFRLLSCSGAGLWRPTGPTFGNTPQQSTNFLTFAPSGIVKGQRSRRGSSASSGSSTSFLPKQTTGTWARRDCCRQQCLTVPCGAVL